jgi:hypothetical protein
VLLVALAALGCEENDPESLLDPGQDPVATVVAINELTRSPGVGAQLNVGQTVNYSVEAAWQSTGGEVAYILFEVGVFDGDDYLGWVVRESLDLSGSRGEERFTGTFQVPDPVAIGLSYTDLNYWVGLYDQDDEFITSDVVYYSVPGAAGMEVQP